MPQLLQKVSPGKLHRHTQHSSLTANRQLDWLHHDIKSHQIIIVVIEICALSGWPCLEPDIVIVSRVHQADKLLAVACDGVWDVLSTLECCSLLVTSLDFHPGLYTSS